MCRSIPAPAGGAPHHALAGIDPRPVYVTFLPQQLHLQPIAALDVLTALAAHLAGRSSFLETQVEEWSSIDDLSPAPAHRQQLVSPPPPPPPPSLPY